MVFRTVTLLLVAGLGSACALAQDGKAMLDGTAAVTRQVDAQKPTELTNEARGDIFMARKMYREAIEAYKAGSPKDPVLLNKIGIAYHQFQQLDTARRFYERALKVKPDYVEAMNNLGTIHYYHKNYRRAIGW